MSNSTCRIHPDPDIAGIGVRIAVYLQALLPLMPIVLVPHSLISAVHVGLLEKYCKRGNGSLVVFSSTSAALLVTAFIERRAGTLSPYHALVILNLTWIVLISALCRASLLYYPQKYGVPHSYVHQLNAQIKEQLKSGRTATPQKGKAAADDAFYKFSRHVSVMCLHLLGTGVLGWLLFVDIEGFAAKDKDCPKEGVCPNDGVCANDTVLWTFASPVHVTNPTPRLFWKSVYMTTILSLISLPILCMLIHTIFKLTFTAICVLWANIPHKTKQPSQPASQPAEKTRAIADPPASSRLSLRAFEVLCVLLLVLLVLSTEQTIAGNPVTPGENSLGFGQILALVLAFVALCELLADGWLCWKLHRAQAAGSHGEHGSPA